MRVNHHDKSQVNYYLGTLQTPLSASQGDCQNNIVPFWELVSQPRTKISPSVTSPAPLLPLSSSEH